MSTSESSESTEGLAAARERIAVAYDPRLLRDAGHRLAALLADHIGWAEDSTGPVLPWVEPPDAIAQARAQLHADDGELVVGERKLSDAFARLVETMLKRGLNLHDPRYIGHQVPAPVPVAGLFDAVGSVTNQVMAIYEMGPWATAVEQAMVQELGEIIGWARGTFAGSATHGGSLANLTALLTARNARLKKAWDYGLAAHEAQPVLVAHADAHYSVARAAGILGLGSRTIVRAPLDPRGRMDPEQLDEELARLRGQNQPVIAVVACACATPTGAFDPLEDVAEVCQRHDVWLHVDAAHGGAAMLSERYRHLLAGLDRADSVVWDAHKMLFVPALCAFVFYRERDHAFTAFHQDAPYLFDPAAPGLAEYDSGVRTVECTKRAAVFGLWGVWSLFGRQLFTDMVDVTFALGRTFYEKLREADDFVPLHEPQCNIVAFRHVPREFRDADSGRLDALQFELRRRLVQSGEFYIVPTKHDGVGALRVTIINPLTTPDHLDQLMAALRRQARVLLGH